MRGRVLVASAFVLSAAGIGGWWVVARASEPGSANLQAQIDPDTMRLVDAGVRVKVELLNASGQRGLARRAMHYFRERGFDVVSVGNATQKSDSSVVFDRTGHPEWAKHAVRALGAARTESRPDESRYLDLTIVLGATFRPPAQILYP
jgi:hypothetical protein